MSRKFSISFSGHYLIYVTRYDIISRDKVVDVYEYEGDVFHAMGEIFFRSINEIYYMNFVDYSDSSVKYWANHGVSIRKWFDKY